MATVPETHAPNRFERRKIQSRAQILEAALDLFREKGIRDTTIEEICERADVANRTFFNHFETRGHLIRAIGRQRLRWLDIDIGQLRRHERPTPEVLSALFDDIGDYLQASGPTYRELIGEMLALDHWSSDDGTGGVDALHAMVLPLIEDGAARGEVTDRHSPATLTDIIAGTLLAALTRWATDVAYELEPGLHDAGAALVELITPKHSRVEETDHD